jgi:uncharacterized protein YndB with AHSA1/START domain
MNDRDLGTLAQQSDDEWTITFTRRLPHPPDKVWRAVTEPEHMAVWFPDEMVGDRQAGAPLKFVTAHGDGFEGEMIVFDPPSVMELLWGTDRLRIEVRPDENGDGTVLTLVDTITELGKAARDAAGWHECLDRLVCELQGVEPPKFGSAWAAINAVYVERFGPEASTIGPPPGWEPEQ